MFEKFSILEFNIFNRCVLKNLNLGASLVVQWFKNLPANAGDTGSSPGLGRSHMPRSN